MHRINLFKFTVHALLKGDKMKPLRFNYEKTVSTHGVGIADAARELAEMFTDGYYLWLARLYDRQTGGFYYADSSRDNEGFLPDIESTCQALGILRGIGMGDSSELPERMKEEIIRFTKSLQDQGDGYFYHKQWGKDITPSRRGRDLDSSVGVLRSLGSKPDYPTALERILNQGSGESASTVPDYLKSKEAFIAWLDEMNISERSYPKGHMLDSLSSQIKAAGLADVCVDYLNERQFADSGLWEKTENYQSANGMLKISTVYPRFKREFPNVYNAAETQIRTALSDEPTVGITDIYNPWVALNILSENARDYGAPGVYEAIRARINENAPALLRKTKEKLMTFSKPDGSFSYCHTHSSATSQGAPASLGVFEGDVNASALALVTARHPFKLLGIDAGAMTDESDRREFLRAAGHPID